MNYFRPYFRPIAAAAVLLTNAFAGSPEIEDFSEPLEKSWIIAEGKWSIREGHAVAEGEFCRLEKKDFSEADVEVVADVAYLHDAPFASAGIQVRLADDGSGYAIGLREVERGVDPRWGPWERPLIQIFRMEKDGWKMLQEAKVMDCRSGEMRKIKVQCKGPDLFVYYQDMEIPVLREFDDRYQKSGAVALWKDRLGSAMYDNVRVSKVGATPAPSLRTDWSWVKGAVYVRSDAVNSVQMWHEYWDHTETVDRELGFAETYGFNMVQVYLQWIAWERDPADYLKRVDDFLSRAARHGLKVNLIFWDDCGHVEPSLEFSAPVPGRHNSQMMMNPSFQIRDSKAEMEAHKDHFRDYVQGLAKRFKDDPRIAFWQIYNEAMGARETYRISDTDANIDTLLSWTRGWIKETGTKIPVTATTGGFQGAKYSDFPTYHSYCGVAGQPLSNTDGGPEHLCTETLNRPNSDVFKVVNEIGGKKNGFVLWELMIGRDNCRFPWGNPDGPAEPAVPFHGVIYPDGHPWDVGEVRQLMGAEKFGHTGLFEVSYFEGEFEKEKKRSVTPLIDFNLGDEPGTGSPDASAGIAKDHFSIRWTGNFTAPENGEFTFSINTDGAAVLRISHNDVIDSVAGGAGKTSLKKGESYPVEIEYVHATGDSKIRVSWSTATTRDTLLKADAAK